ncbi:MAG: PilZ domain-containing protein [Deltaproteobacteria bacterium]|nr:PilZ domain-containing protein [Deltaproteobacteria bacterium]
MSKRQELLKTPARRASRERRSSERIRLTLDVAVPVLVKAGDQVQWGMARNVSEGGMLIELKDPPGIGREVEISFPGVPGSEDAPEHGVLRGEVRHQMKWNFAPERSRDRLSAIGVKFLNGSAQALPPAGWVH